MSSYLKSAKISWRWFVAFMLFLCSIIGLSSGVALTERPDVVDASLLTKAYYSLGLFVVGGLDLGIPTGGPLLGRILLWIAYFGAPILAASALLEAVLIAVSHRRQLQRMKNHIVIVGSGDITTSYLRVLRAHDPHQQVVIVDHDIDQVRKQELINHFAVTVVVGDITHEFLLKKLQLATARRLLLLVNDDFLAFEAANKTLQLFPKLQTHIIIHVASLRFLRAMQNTQISNQTVLFNAYNLAAKGFVKNRLIQHFLKTQGKDTVVLAGFGLFGQTILEELQANAPHQIDTVAIIDLRAKRRIQVVEEQAKLTKTQHRRIYQGDIANPGVWRDLQQDIDLGQGEPVVILGIGDSANNLRTALWIKRKYPKALVFVRTQNTSEFALTLSKEYDICCTSITQLVEDNIPKDWVA